MRKSLLVGLAVAAPILFASGASACGWGCDCAPSYGYSYGYSAPRVYGYSSYGYGSYYRGGKCTRGWDASRRGSHLCEPA